MVTVTDLPQVYLVTVDDVDGVHWATRDKVGTFWRWRPDGSVTPESPMYITRVSGPHEVVAQN